MQVPQGPIELQHSAVDEDAAYGLLGTARNLNGTGNHIEFANEFLRYVRVKAASVEGAPLVSVYAIAKE